MCTEERIVCFVAILPFDFCNDSDLASLLFLLVTIYYSSHIFCTYCMKKVMELCRWFMNCIILSRTGKNGWQEHWVFFF